MCIISMKRSRTKYSEEAKLNYLRLYHESGMSKRSSACLPPKSLQNAKENLIGVLENKTEFFIQHKV